MRASGLVDSLRRDSKKLGCLSRREWQFDLLVEVDGPIEYLVTELACDQRYKRFSFSLAFADSEDKNLVA